MNGEEGPRGQTIIFHIKRNFHPHTRRYLADLRGRELPELLEVEPSSSTIISASAGPSGGLPPPRSSSTTRSSAARSPIGSRTAGVRTGPGGRDDAPQCAATWQILCASSKGAQWCNTAVTPLSGTGRVSCLSII